MTQDKKLPLSVTMDELRERIAEGYDEGSPSELDRLHRHVSNLLAHVHQGDPRYAEFAAAQARLDELFARSKKKMET